MQVTETLSDGLRRAYTVVIPAADLEGKRDAKLAEVGRTLKLPGFRPGKVPLTLVRQRYGSSIMADVLQQSVNAATDQVISERGLRPVGSPKVDLVGAIEPGAGAPVDLEFNVELEILPEITVPDLSGMAFTRLSAEPTETAFTEAFARIAERHRELDSLGDTPAARGHIVVTDYTGTIDGIEFAGGTARAAEIEIGGEGYVPGFADALEGIRADETRTFEVTFPPDYLGKTVAGKTAQFVATAASVNRAALPDLAGLAEKLGLGSPEALSTAVRSSLQQEYDNLSRLRLKRDVLDALAERAAFPAPQGLVQAEFNAIWERVKTDLAAGESDIEDVGKDDATLAIEYRAIADRRVRLGLLLSEIGRANAIQVTQEEMRQALRVQLGRYPGMETQLLDFYRQNPQAAEGIRGPIFEDKVVDYILELATVDTRIVPAEALSLEAESSVAASVAATEAGTPDVPPPQSEPV